MSFLILFVKGREPGRVDSAAERIEGRLLPSRVIDQPSLQLHASGPASSAGPAPLALDTLDYERCVMMGSLRIGPGGGVGITGRPCTGPGPRCSFGGASSGMRSGVRVSKLTNCDARGRTS